MNRGPGYATANVIGSMRSRSPSRAHAWRYILCNSIDASDVAAATVIVSRNNLNNGHFPSWGNSRIHLAIRPPVETGSAQLSHRR